MASGFWARFVFSARGVALLMRERAENGAATPRSLALGGPDSEATSEAVLGVVRFAFETIHARNEMKTPHPDVTER